MRSYRYLHLDVFTDRLFGGNQLAVFPDARGLSTEAMQAIAKEMNFSETTFVLPKEQIGTDMRVRIFTPSVELSMAGHPTIGTAFALARAGVLGPANASCAAGCGGGHGRSGSDRLVRRAVCYCPGHDTACGRQRGARRHGV